MLIWVFEATVYFHKENHTQPDLRYQRIDFVIYLTSMVVSLQRLTRAEAGGPNKWKGPEGKNRIHKRGKKKIMLNFFVVLSQCQWKGGLISWEKKLNMKVGLRKDQIRKLTGYFKVATLRSRQLTTLQQQYWWRQGHRLNDQLLPLANSEPTCTFYLAL